MPLNVFIGKNLLKLCHLPINVKPEGLGVGHRLGILTYFITNYQNPHPQEKKKTIKSISNKWFSSLKLKD